MPRRARRILGGCVYHLLNRSAGRVRLFHKPADYLAFDRILQETRQAIPLRVLGWCLMPNHWHLLVWPGEGRGEAVSRFMRLLTVTHASRWRRHRGSVGEGPVYQGRFKSFAIADDRHYLTALRYVETNAWRAGLCGAGPAESWRWSSLWCWSQGGPPERTRVEAGPLDRPSHWLRTANTAMNTKELETLRRTLARGTPYGGPAWTQQMAKALGLPHPPRPRGRPRKDGTSRHEK